MFSKNAPYPPQQKNEIVDAIVPKVTEAVRGMIRGHSVRGMIRKHVGRVASRDMVIGV